MAQVVLNGTSTGQNLYFRIIDPLTGNNWNTSGTPAFEAYNASNWASYAIALTEDGASMTYRATFPSIAAYGEYILHFYKRLGGSAAVGDTPIAVEVYPWNGSTRIPRAASDTSGNMTVGAFNGVVGDMLKAGFSTTVNDVSPTTTQFKIAGGSTVDSIYAGSIAAFITGNNSIYTGGDRPQKISAYVGSTGLVTIADALHTAPANGDRLVILGLIHT